MGNERGNHISIGKISLKLKEKIRKKTRGLIYEKPLKLNEETRKKTDYLLLCKI